MSDLRPKGVPVEIGGEEHYLLFTKTILTCLLNDEQKRNKFYGEAKEAKAYTEEEVGWMVTETDKYVIIEAILKAYGVSLPETEEESPNAKSVQQPEKN